MAMTASLDEPVSMKRAKAWDEMVENNYRFQLAGYRDENEYKKSSQMAAVFWPNNGLVKKLQRKDGCFYYYNRKRECADKDLFKVKMYIY